MTTRDTDAGLTLALGLGSLLCGFALGMMAGCKLKGEIETERWQRSCIERGVAQYDQTTGAWNWKPEFKRGDGYEHLIPPDPSPAPQPHP